MSSGDRMRGERYQNAIVLLLAVLVFASIPLIVNLAGIWFLWAPLLAALAVLPSAFLRETDLAAGLQGPSHVRDALAADLRQAGVAVTPEADSVVGRLDALSAVSFRTRITDQGTVLSGRLRATPIGWFLVVALVVSVVGSGPAALLVLALFLRATRFSRSWSRFSSRSTGSTSRPGYGICPSPRRSGPRSPWAWAFSWSCGVGSVRGSLAIAPGAPDSVVLWRARCLPRIGSHPRQAPSNSSPRLPCKSRIGSRPSGSRVSAGILGVRSSSWSSRTPVHGSS